MRLLFAGTPEIAAVVLQALLGSEHEVVAVVTQPDRPAGRGRQLLASPVKELALAYNKPVLQPVSLNTNEVQAQLHAYAADLMIVVAYGLIVPKAVLQIPKLGCWNIHVSLLPRWRGAAPIQRAIEAGDVETGITLMQMDAGLDTGPILLQKSCQVLSDMTAGKLHDVLAKQGAQLVLQGLGLQQAGSLEAKPQPDRGVTYAHKLSKDEARLNWQASAVVLACKVRAFNPFPICTAEYQGQTIRVWEAEATPDQAHGKPGEIIDIQQDGLVVQAGVGALKIKKIQLPGMKALPLEVFLNGRPDLFKKQALFS